MVSFNFQPEFIPDIESGRKVGTIRQTRRCEPGQRMHLYTGLRTKECKLIAVKECSETLRCIIEPRGICLQKSSAPREHFGLILLPLAASDLFAISDGFASYMRMYEWFLDRYKQEVFHGFVHRWKP